VSFSCTAAFEANLSNVAYVRLYLEQSKRRCRGALNSLQRRRLDAHGMRAWAQHKIIGASSSDGCQHLAC
jgi:hypothetical protein